MREVSDEIRRWRKAGRPVALATVVKTWGSAPRGVGSKMAITADGDMAGSVSGGCVEGAVAEAALAVLGGAPPALLTFGVADETAWEVGLACGGTIQVFVEAIENKTFAEIEQMIAGEHLGAVITVVDGDNEWIGRKVTLRQGEEPMGTIDPQVDAAVIAAARAAMQAATPQRIEFDKPVLELFIDVLAPPPTLIIVGGVHIAIPLTTMAKTLGYRTIVIDPRRAFGTEARFPHVDRLLQQWPQDALPDLPINGRTAVALLTHDPKIDDPALELLLPGPAFYVGALGSRKTHARRVARLRDAGMAEAQIARIHAPIGLKIGARSPEEIALAIMAEIIAASHEAGNPTSPSSARR